MALKNLGKLIDSILTLSRLSRKPLEASDIDMEALAKNVFEELKLINPERRNLQFSIKTLPICRADRSLLRQVFFNLLSNAIKFTKLKETAIIEVGGWSQEAENVYYVKDNGAGFNMRYANKLFGVFQRLHAASDFEGTGVGLATVQRIIHRHGGRVWAEGKVNEGATFYFSLFFTPKERHVKHV